MILATLATRHLGFIISRCLILCEDKTLVLSTNILFPQNLFFHGEETKKSHGDKETFHKLRCLLDLVVKYVFAS